MLPELKTIAYIQTDFPTKAGIPRQSGLIDELKATIIFEPEYRVQEALRGIEAFSHLWLIWGFSEANRESWSPTVRPPRLGGNTRVGVFATRSPFRPNALGLSCVRFESVEVTTKYGAVLHVCGADLMSGSPIYDIKPYLSFADSHPDAMNGFAGAVYANRLEVEFARSLAPMFDEAQYKALCAVLSQDPRPAYHDDPDRVYGFPFAGCEVKFCVKGDVLHVISVSYNLNEE